MRLLLISILLAPALAAAGDSSPQRNDQPCERAYTDSEGDAGSYTGQCQDGVPHGYGYVQYLNGDEYEGSFSNGDKNGQGIMVWPDGANYQGGWADNKRNGHGTALAANGGVAYRGEWLDNKMHGEGVMVWPDVGRYEGGWRDGAKYGNGIMVLATGERYVGSFTGFLNWGRLYLKDGTECEVRSGDLVRWTYGGRSRKCKDFSFGHLVEKQYGSYYFPRP